jgi:hypothetical protein
MNQNYSSRAGTGYHVQIEDRGPVFDDVTEEWVRRVNTIVYAHYGEPTARIVYGRDQDFPDVRTQEHTRPASRSWRARPAPSSRSARSGWWSGSRRSSGTTTGRATSSRSASSTT